MASIVCISCNFTISVDSKFCAFCGVPIDSLDSLVTQYFRKGFQYESIVQFLSKFNGINISLPTLKSKSRELNLKRRSFNVDFDLVCQRMRELLDGSSCMGGYRAIWHTLNREGIQVPLTHVQHLVEDLDPEGCELRRTRRLRCRSYHSPGPNYCWHVDGYDKIKPCVFPLHGCIEGWSRRIMWFEF